MRLELLCEFRLSYDHHGLTLLRPFAGHEAQGFGTGTGTATGDRLAGEVRWANYPRMTDSGLLMPDVRGVIATDGGPVLFEFHGYSLQPAEGSTTRSVVASIMFRTEIADHLWLNHTIAVHDGTIDFTTMSTRFPAYACLPAEDG